MNSGSVERSDAAWAALGPELPSHRRRSGGQRAQRPGIPLAGSRPTPAISTQTALRDGSARAPASGHLNPTLDWRADATPGRRGGGDREANGEPGTGPEGLPACFPRLPGDELVAKRAVNCSTPSLSPEASHQEKQDSQARAGQGSKPTETEKAEREGGVQEGESGDSRTWGEKEVWCVVAKVRWESPGLRLEG